MRMPSSEGLAIAEEAKVSTPFKIPQETLTRLALASEYAQVRRTPIDGIFVSPSADNSYVWHGVIFIRKGIFGGGIFRFQILIPEAFPDTVELPRVFFKNSIFHPLINWKTNQLDLTRSFLDGWKREKHNLLRVLVVIQRIFFSYQFDCERCVNPEAAILYKEHKDKFKELANDVVETSRAQVYDDPEDMEDRCSIKFTPWDPSVHKFVRREMMIIGSGERVVQNATQSGKKRVGAPTVAEFRRDRDVRERGIVVAELVGKHFPNAYTWFDPEAMTVLTDEMEKEENSAMNSARLDREKYGIEPLDLSMMSALPSKNNSPHVDKDEEPESTDGHRKLKRSESLEGIEIGLKQNGEDSVI